MRTDCTDLFNRYREIARLVWNLGFYPDPEIRELVSRMAYDQAMSRLFQGMVLLRFGCDEQINLHPGGLGDPLRFGVGPNSEHFELTVSQSPLKDGVQVYGETVRPSEGTFDLRFMSFFDWDTLAVNDSRYLLVLVERLEQRPELAGHLALVETAKCRIWLDEEDEA